MYDIFIICRRDFIHRLKEEIVFKYFFYVYIYIYIYIWFHKSCGRTVGGVFILKEGLKDTYLVAKEIHHHGLKDVYEEEHAELLTEAEHAEAEHAEAEHAEAEHAELLAGEEHAEININKMVGVITLRLRQNPVRRVARRRAGARWVPSPRRPKASSAWSS